jgi:rhamnopyranosyl-N-acetylglucosaminyl-diphospho-decaprenol beta-1,3/1,4-galactofuranosyltransferase
MSQSVKRNTDADSQDFQECWGGSKTSLSIASVTLAHNAARILPRQMDALLRQSRPIDEIIVVDSGSTDGTGDLLAERYPELTVLRLSENLGAAGAWAAGLSYAAITKKHDWVWTFDDDSVPEIHSLETLLDSVATFRDRDTQVGIIAPLCVHQQTGTCYPPLLWRDGYIKPSEDLLRQPVCFADLTFTSGSMVRRDVVNKIGLPRADFFMDFVDFEYCLRARSHNYQIAIITQTKLAHTIGNARQVRLFGRSHLWTDHAPWREYYVSRNLVYAAWWLYPSLRTKQFVIGWVARHAGAVLLFGSNKLACLRKVAQGFWDGRRANLGVRFRPS